MFSIRASTKPLPRWLQLRIAVSTLTRKSRGLGNVFMLPFNKVAKLAASANEIATLVFLRANTSIPVPKSTWVVLEIYDRQPDGSAHIVMTRVRGDDLGCAISKMSAAQVVSVVKELVGYLAQIRRLEKDGAKGSLIGGLDGIPGFDHRLGPYPWGPFGTTAEFHTYVRFGEALADWAHEPAVMAIHGKPEGAYKLKLSHADIAPRNIMVKDGKITGIIDWELAGWYPEYWEYTKMFYGGETPAWKKWFDAVEGEMGIEKYKEERTAEEVIWVRAKPVGYNQYVLELSAYSSIILDTSMGPRLLQP